jgi:serine/threonine protein kinase
MLSSLAQAIHSVLPTLSAANQSTLSIISEMIASVMNATANDLFSVVDSTIASVRSLSGTESPNLKVEKAIQGFLQALVAISKLTQDLERSSRSELAVTAPEPTDVRSELVLVCRICDTAVPADVFEEHTNSCAALYQSQPIITSVNEQLSEPRRAIGEAFLQVQWPGERELGVKSLIPALQIYALCCWAMRLDPSVSDTLIELKWIKVILAHWPLDAFPGLAPFVEDTAKVINEKIKISNAMLDAITILRRQGSAPRPIAPSIADFTFLKRISRGATASVFLARKKKTGDLFAIKATPREALQQKNQAQRLLVEKDILLQLSHPHIVNFFYSIVGENNLYLVTEFVQGGDLYSLLQNLGSLDEDVTKFYAKELLHALQFLRQNGICHRDIKPDNILISATGHLKLTDFGLSFLGMVDRASDGGRLMSEAKSFVGTPDYIAPEIILNHPHSFSVDYWSLGILIYELVYGEPPFHRETEQETYRCALLGRLQFPSDVEVSPEFVHLVRRLLAVDPIHRIGHTSIDEIVNHPWFAGVDTGARPPFIPRLASDLDTGYFEHRYAFNPAEDLAVLKDLQPEVRASDMAVVGSFSSVALNQLQRKNKQMANASGTQMSISSSASDLLNCSKARHRNSHIAIRPSASSQPPPVRRMSLVPHPE